MKYSNPVTMMIFFLSVTAALAVGLTESDYNYLETQNIERRSALIKNLSPKEQAGLHALINDETTKNNPVIHTQNINKALAQFSLNQLWEPQNQGRPWNAIGN